MMPVEIDEPLMTEIASMTGGRYFRATDAQSLRNVFAEINRLEKTPVEQVVYRRFAEADRTPPAPRGGGRAPGGVGARAPAVRGSGRAHISTPNTRKNPISSSAWT